MVKSNLFIVGFSGTGKSTVGPKVAEVLGMQYLDTDALIEKRMQLSVVDIFKLYGQAYFRQLEESIFKKDIPENSTVVVCGGGAVTIPSVLDTIKKSRSVLLKASPKSISKRLKTNSAQRPLLEGDKNINAIEKLLSERMLFYKGAGIEIDTENLSIDEVATAIVKMYQFFGK